MFFLGDIAFPKGTPESISCTEKRFATSPVIANLEGAILPEDSSPQDDSLYNDRAVLSYLHKNNVRLVSLANNHITDIDCSPKRTVHALQEHGILSCGAGDSLEEASRPVLLKDPEGETVFLGFGWSPIGCRVASQRTPGVNPLSHDSVLDGVERAKQIFPGRRIVLLMHWNYELEIYPQPMHRQMAHEAIRHGASAVIGCHSHCVQGIEMHLGNPIVYGLGNWYVPEGFVFGRNLKFPDFALRQLAFEWVPSANRMNCHWYSYNRSIGSVEYEMSEALESSTRIRALTPFDSMTHGEYVRWFRKHRRKNILLPVYGDAGSHVTNRLKDAWVRGRHILMSIAAATNLKGGLR
ncbi:hypothetical protein W02_06970 [Nitrospira sp. KM1]|nr:hypothetical protein W02_06970 [Nitrospira sp. KM1]